MNEITDTDYEPDYFEICLLEMLVSETQTYYIVQCKHMFCCFCCAICFGHVNGIHFEVSPNQAGQFLNIGTDYFC